MSTVYRVLVLFTSFVFVFACDSGNCRMAEAGRCLWRVQSLISDQDPSEHTAQDYVQWCFEHL